MRQGQSHATIGGCVIISRNMQENSTASAGYRRCSIIIYDNNDVINSIIPPQNFMTPGEWQRYKLIIHGIRGVITPGISWCQRVSRQSRHDVVQSIWTKHHGVQSKATFWSRPVAFYFLRPDASAPDRTWKNKLTATQFLVFDEKIHRSSIMSRSDLKAMAFGVGPGQ